MKNKSEILEEIKNRYQAILTSPYFLNMDKMTWFVTAYNLETDDSITTSRVLYGINSEGEIIIVDGKEEIDRALYVLNNEFPDMTVEPLYFEIATLDRFGNGEEFSILKKYPDLDFVDIDENEYQFINFVINCLNKALEYHYDELVNEKEDYLHYLNEDMTEMSKELFAREFPFTEHSNIINDIKLDENRLIDDTAVLNVFSLNIPVYSRNRQQIVNPYYVLYLDDGLRGFLLDTPKDNLSRSILELLKSFTKLPRNLEINSIECLLDIENTLKETGIEVSLGQADFSDLVGMFEYDAVIIGDNLDFFNYNHYIEYDDCKESFQKLNAVRDFMIRYNTSEDGVDLDAFRTMNESLFKVFEELSINAQKAKFIRKAHFVWFATEQLYFSIDSDDTDIDDFLDEPIDTIVS